MHGVRVCGRWADKLRSRGFGKSDGQCLILAYEEALYLAERGTAGLEFEKVFNDALGEEGFDIRFFVYRDLRSRGYTLKVKDGCFFGKKSFGMCFYPIADDEFMGFEDMLSRAVPYILAVVDGDGDLTYYMVEEIEPEGKNSEQIRIVAPRVSNRRVFSLKSNRTTGTFGKDEGAFRHYSLLEYYYLTGAEPARYEPEYRVYEDLRNRGMIVKSGFKYGTHFRVYEESMTQHAKYLVYVMRGRESMLQISRAVRVAHGVRKTLIFAKNHEGRVRYLAMSWIRP